MGGAVTVDRSRSQEAAGHAEVRQSTGHPEQVSARIGEQIGGGMLHLFAPFGAAATRRYPRDCPAAGFLGRFAACSCGGSMYGSMEMMNSANSL